MSRPTVIRPRAEDDIADAQAWYNSQRDGLGDEFVSEALAAIRRIATSSVTPREVYPGVRRVLLARFPYSVFYADTPERIAVVAVYHGRRDPTGWVERLSEEDSVCR